MDSSEIRTQLARLHIERIDATEIGLADNDVYMADLEEEILECRTQLAIAAVTEVAVARAEHTGRLLGRTSRGPKYLAAKFREPVHTTGS